MNATTVGIDLAKDVFQVAVSAHVGSVTGRLRLNRRRFALFVESLEPGTTVVMETCSMAHYWGRRCQARGAIVRLLPAQYVRPYVRRDKTDRADAEALLEAHRCDAIHPVPVKTTEQQTLQSLHRLRQQWQTTRTARLNLLRACTRRTRFGVSGRGDHGATTHCGPHRGPVDVTPVPAADDAERGPRRGPAP